MEKIKQVKPVDLEGYRNPSKSEKQKILNLMQPELRKNRKQMRMLSSILACSSVVATVTVISKLIEGAYDAKGAIFSFVVVAVLWICFIADMKSITTNKILEKNLQNGKFEVLDCIPFWQYYNQDEGRTEGSVKVQTKSGVPCMVNYVVDIETAMMCEKNKEITIPMLLMFERETKESRVFTERMLSKGGDKDEICNQLKQYDTD